MAASPDILSDANGNPFTLIEERHGDDCTCKPMGHIAIDLVAASRACPGDRNPYRGGSVAAQLDDKLPPTYPGRIIITWGGADPRGWQTAIHDADTCELIPVCELRLYVDANSPAFKEQVVVEARLLVVHNRQPLIGTRAGVPYPDPTGTERFASRWFRCHVAEMRTRPAAPTAPTRESVNRGEHTVNQYREHHGIDGAHPDLVVIDETQGFGTRPTQ